MDLRKYNFSAKQIDQAKKFILSRKLLYQLFIITDELEVGEGKNYHDGYSKPTANVFWPDAPPEVRDLCTDDLQHFRNCNAGYRALYDHFIGCVVGRKKRGTFWFLLNFTTPRPCYAVDDVCELEKPPAESSISATRGLRSLCRKAECSVSQANLLMRALLNVKEARSMRHTARWKARFALRPRFHPMGKS